MVERVVLALSGRNDAIAERGGELDQFHATRRFVASPDGIDDPKAVGLRLQIGTDGDVGLDIHHDQMLAVFHGKQVVVCRHSRFAGGIDHHIDLRRGNEGFCRADGQLARLDGL